MSTKDTNPKDAAATNRIPLWLLSPIAKAQWSIAQFAGMIKYGAWNWRAAGVRTSVYLSAIDRHLSGYLSGEEHDPIDGTHHLANIMACCAILLDAKAAGKLTDDRPPSVDMRPAYAEGEALMGRLRDQYADKAPRHYTIADTAPDSEPEPPPDTVAPVAVRTQARRRYTLPASTEIETKNWGVWSLDGALKEMNDCKARNEDSSCRVCDEIEAAIVKVELAG